MVEIHEKFGKVLVFMDNVSFHKKAALRKMTRDTGGDMQFKFFSPHTPELNPIEIQWAQFERSLSEMEFESAEEIADTPQRGINSKCCRWSGCTTISWHDTNRKICARFL